MATHSSILAWRITWTEEPGRLWFIGYKESDMKLSSNIHMHVFEQNSLVYSYYILQTFFVLLLEFHTIFSTPGGLSALNVSLLFL